MSMKDIQDIRSHFSYCPETGRLTRVTRKNANGSIDAYGYLIIKFKGSQYKAHRLCWAIYHGKWPEGVIDHINGVKTDNRIENLRDVEQAENVRNRSDDGIYVDETTKGLKAKYTVRGLGSSKRFRDIAEARNYRAELDKAIGITRRTA